MQLRKFCADNYECSAEKHLKRNIVINLDVASQNLFVGPGISLKQSSSNVAICGFGSEALFLSQATNLVMRSALFWDFTQCRMVVPYRRFGTNYWCLEDMTDRSSRNVGKQLPFHAA
jgi:hypothetical protein